MRSAPEQTTDLTPVPRSHPKRTNVNPWRSDPKEVIVAFLSQLFLTAYHAAEVVDPLNDDLAPIRQCVFLIPDNQFVMSLIAVETVARDW
jgi:hypothetical protein